MRILTLLVLFAALSCAATLTIIRTPGNAYDAANLTGYATSGSMMDGMIVTATYAGGATETATWGTTGPDAGAAQVADAFTLSLQGDTFGAAWILTNYKRDNLIALTISGREGRTVFDTISDPELSPGSARGWGAAYTPVDNGYPEGVANYTNPLWIGGTFYEDLYLTLGLTFGDGLAPLASLEFIADTDNVPEGTPINPAVPEPATMSLLGAGLCAIWWGARRRSHS